MAINFSAYLAFSGETPEALEFYKSVFGGTVDLNKFGEMGAGAGFDPDAIMHGQLTTDAGWTLMAADSTKPGDELVRGGSTLTLWGDEHETMEQQFKKLAEGGTIGTPLEKQMWGAVYGDLTDKFGITWSFNIG
ncbi:VOC family protein [Cumulibacter manganitolerans]|uniref:VOC family protein n=1 Tax=Cumulibacter manganitolerans TaxID=1884992 RepID=UPI00129502CA|nr:glyoxalase/bleomycin resistance/extradiol dioxygenase family protein [Cumulibacter manganitolerans]